MKNILLLGIAGLLAACAPVGAKPEADNNAAGVERGRYLVTIGGCNDCHTPHIVGPNGLEPDMTRMLSGHPESVTMPPAPETRERCSPVVP